MIFGIGTDIVEVSRILKGIENLNFKTRVYSKNEIIYCESKPNKAEHFAVRFAAKEAFLKALGTGLRGLIALNEIEVQNDELGKPTINLIEKSLETISQKNIGSIYLSLSHTSDSAVAMVVIESKT